MTFIFCHTHPLVGALVIILVLLMRSVCLQDFEPDCGEIKNNVDNGMVRLPDIIPPEENISCIWQYSAPPGRKLLVKVDNVKLLNPYRIASLQLYLNGKQYVLPKNCVRCLREKLNAEVIRVHFISLLNTSHFTESEPPSDILLAGDVGTFQIRFKSFDPLHCEPPVAPRNGFIMGEETNIGHKIKYGCHPPYDLIGALQSQCIIPRDLPVPVWSPTPPICAMSNCSGSPIHRYAGSGAIANPAYPIKLLHPNQHCHWIVEADLNNRIMMSFIYVDVPVITPQRSQRMPSAFDIVVFDRDSEQLLVNITAPTSAQYLNFTSQSNVVFIKMNNYLKSDVEGGFYMEYSAYPIECPMPLSPVDGDVIALSLRVGSSIAFRCNPGLSLIGDLHAECLPNGQWSSGAPTCVPIVETATFNITQQNDTVESLNASLVEIPSGKTQLLSKFSKLKPKPTAKIQTKHPHPIKDEFAVTSKPQLEDSFETNEGGLPPSKGSFSKKKQPGDFGPDDEVHHQQAHSSRKESDAWKSRLHEFNTGGAGGAQPTGGLKPLHAVSTSRPGYGYKESNIPDNSSTEGGDSEPTVDLQISSASAPDKGENADDESESAAGGFADAFLSFQMIIIVAGVLIPLILIVIIVVAVLLYRKKYPVRMRFGRKFSTFENPMYVRKDAQSPRELSKLTETT